MSKKLHMIANWGQVCADYSRQERGMILSVCRDRGPHQSQSILTCILLTTQCHNISLSDFPTHDMSADFVLLSEQRRVEKELRELFEVGCNGLIAYLVI